MKNWQDMPFIIKIVSVPTSEVNKSFLHFSNILFLWLLFPEGRSIWGDCRRRKFINYDHDYLLKRMVDEFKKRYGVECFAAPHHNKRKTNLHIHMIFAERKRLEQPTEKTATRNMFYDEQGRHVRTKKEILDGDGNICKGCKIIKKGEVYGPYLATKKVGKNNPKAEEIKADNEIRMEWNRAVDRAIVSGVPEEEILELKKTEITDRVKESVEQNGKKPELFAQHFIIFSRVRLFLKQ